MVLLLMLSFSTLWYFSIDLPKALQLNIKSTISIFFDNTANEIALLGERQVINEDGIEVDVIIIPEDVADSYEGSVKEVTY